MLVRLYVIVSLLLLGSVSQPLLAQSNPPWRRPLKMAYSEEGSLFAPPITFQDSSGVPSVIKWKGDTLLCVFQWFRLPVGTPTWDRVAVKYSYNNGQSWTAPQPIVLHDFPANYQRPFDPTLAVLSADSLRIYFSSSEGIPPMGQDASINTYSAVSADGLNYYFEPGPRVDVADNRLIDPAVIRLGAAWHYTAPIGSPQQGAFHFVSPDGVHFSQVPNIPSDNQHNWTGNFMLNNNTELRFYGSGARIWYRSSLNGGVWSNYVNTNLQGGDPSVVQLAPSFYLIIFVGEDYTTAVEHPVPEEETAAFYPNPCRDIVYLSDDQAIGEVLFFDLSGRLVKASPASAGIQCGDLPAGLYQVRWQSKMGPRWGRLLKE